MCMRAMDVDSTDSGEGVNAFFETVSHSSPVSATCDRVRRDPGRRSAEAL